MIARVALLAPLPVILAGCLANPDPPACAKPRAIDELNTPEDEQGPWLSPDRREVFFSSTRDTGLHHLMHASRELIDEPFSDIVPVSGLEIDGTTREPFLEADGKTLWFSRVEASGIPYLYRARRETLRSARFGPAESMDIAGTHPAMTADGLTLVFSARNDHSSKSIFRARRMNDTATFGARAEVASIRDDGVLATAYLRSPTISADGARLLFVASADDLPPFTIYESDLVGDAFEPGVAETDTLAEPPASDEDPSLHFNGETIVFASNRGAGGFVNDLFVGCE